MQVLSLHVHIYISISAYIRRYIGVSLLILYMLACHGAGVCSVGMCVVYTARIAIGYNKRSSRKILAKTGVEITRIKLNALSTVD